MAEDFRRARVRVILDFGYTKYLALDRVSEVHDYGFVVQEAHLDVIIGNWVHFQAELGAPALAEFRRCPDCAAGFVGLAVSGSGGVPASDPAWEPFYRLCIEAKAPALIFVGTTGLGAGLPGGNSIILDSCHPRHLDAVAARFAERVMFAADYPLFGYERIFADWHGLGYSEQVLERIFRRNAETLLAGLRNRGSL